MTATTSVRQWLPYQILSREKAFRGPWLGNTSLNALGLHPARIAVSNLMLRARRRLLPGPVPPELADLLRDGVVAIPDFLPTAVFAEVTAEARQQLAVLDGQLPVPPAAERGHRSEHPFAGGWDRCDGDTVSRYAEVRAGTTPACAAAVRDRRLARLCAFATGFVHRPHRFRILRVEHGLESVQPDDQKVLHKDTFHSAIKVFLFLHDVPLERGPLCYVRGSHRMRPERYRWEYRRARAAVRNATPGGALRVTASELHQLGLPEPTPFTVAANTLVIADVRGFHHRGHAQPGSQRLALYANLRANPFLPVPLAW